MENPCCTYTITTGDADSNVPYDKIRIFKYSMWGSKQIAKSLSKINNPYYLYTFINADHHIAVSPLNNNREYINDFLDKLVDQRLPLKIIKSQVESPFDKKIDKNFKIKDFVKSNFSH